MGWHGDNVGQQSGHDHDTWPLGTEGGLGVGHQSPDQDIEVDKDAEYVRQNLVQLESVDCGLPFMTYTNNKYQIYPNLTQTDPLKGADKRPIGVHIDALDCPEEEEDIEEKTEDGSD